MTAHVLDLCSWLKALEMLIANWKLHHSTLYERTKEEGARGGSCQALIPGVGITRAGVDRDIDRGWVQTTS